MHQHVLDFWFEEIDPAMWFKKDDEFDRVLRTRFGQLWQAASQGELAHWRATIKGRLAEIIVLDQFSRNLFRNTPRSFACDGMALVLAQEAIATGLCENLTVEQRGFLHLERDILEIRDHQPDRERWRQPYQRAVAGYLGRGRVAP